MADDIANRMQVPVDFPAVVSVATLAGVCGRRATIRPKAQDDSWEVIPNLWGAIVADAGMMKSPVIKAVTAPAQVVEKKWRASFEEDHARYKENLEKWNIEKAVSDEVYKKAYRARIKSEEVQLVDRPPLSPKPKPPAQKRLMTTDATPESLHKLLEQNPAGIFVLRDELTGWLANLERKGRESERSFYLECWNGDSGFTVDRIGRGSIYVEHCCVSLFGGIQPARLRQYFAKAAMDQGDDNDGLIQRFQLIIWPDKLEKWSYVDRRRDAAAFEKAEAAYLRIASVDPDHPLRLRFSEEAQSKFVDWLKQLMNVQLKHGDLHPSMESHFAKYRSLMPSLALLFSLADGAFEQVGIEQTERAAQWCDYLMGHAQRVYASKVNPAHSAALVLKKRIEEGRLGGSEGKFSLRDVYKNGWSELSAPEQARAALRVLEEHGWVRQEDETDELADIVGIPRQGRPSEVYRLNPKIKSSPPAKPDHIQPTSHRSEHIASAN